MTTEQPTQEVAEDKAKRRQIDAIFWGGAFILAGLVFLAENLDILPQIGTTEERWFWIFLAAGAWALLLDLFRLASPDWPNPSTGDFIWTAILLLVGLGGAVGLAMVEAGEPITQAFLDRGTWEVDIAGVRYPATVSLRPLFDPKAERIRR